MLELTRGPIDLLITDLKLPGISGLELLEKVHRLNPQARAIVITGHPSQKARSAAEALGVVAFLHKPIGTSLFLEAVERALQLSSEGRPQLEGMQDDKPGIAARLSSLRGQLGADVAYLLDDQGHVAVRAGDLTDLDLEAALPSLMTATESGLKISSLLGSSLPSNLHYFDGKTHDLYLTNIGSSYNLLIAYQGKQGPGQMGEVVHFCSRAAEDLLDILTQMGAMDRFAPAEGEPEIWAAEAEPETKIEVQADKLEEAAKGFDKGEAERFWKDAAAETSGPGRAEGGALTYDQAKKLGLLDEESEQ